MVNSPYQAEPPSLYEVLGVTASASREEIARAYRRKAHLSHPDARPGDPAAPASFREIAHAYEVLTDPARRADYDRRRATTSPSPGSAARRAAGPAGPHPAPGPMRGAGPMSRPGGPALWAGPVHVEPPQAGPATSGASGAREVARLAALMELIGRYLGEDGDWLL